MEESNQTQKEVGQKYRKNLGYFKHPDFLARQKFFLCMLAILLGVYAIVRLELSRSDIVYNPAPLSISHAFLEGNCAACHNLAVRNIFRSIQDRSAPMKPVAWAMDSPAIHQWSSGAPAFFSSSQSINHACQSCHAGLGRDLELHQPSLQTLALKDFHSELHIVAATGCFSCHQEHLGRIDLKLPGDTACAACHNDAAQMTADILRVSLHPISPSTTGSDGVTPDGVVHFIPPERKAPLPLFTAFDHGHPAFEYEQPGLKDPDVLKFSHHQHLHLGGAMKLDCADCHKIAADGMFYQRVTYKDACERCHTLQFDPANPQLLIPHGDVARLRSFLHSLVYQYGLLDQMMQAAQNKVASPADQKAFAYRQILALQQRAHVQSPGDLEWEILFTTDPYKDRPPTAQRPFFSGCAYCHEVSQPAGGGDPVVTRPQMVDRWLAHGAFTHAPHAFMDCAQCHKADNSVQVTDILMPPQSSCVSCHHAQGSAPSNCLACHTFHSPQSAVKAVKATFGLPPLAGCPATPSMPSVASVASAPPMSSFLISQAHRNE